MDIAKDTLYIEHANSKARRAIQTVMYEIVLSLTKLVSPILTHTADEVWPFIPSLEGGYAQLQDMPEVHVFENVEALSEKWGKFMKVRDNVLKSLETARNEKTIGKSLTASITLYPNKEINELLGDIENLHKLFIVSEATIGGELEKAPDNAQRFENLAIVVEKAQGETCERCWIVTSKVGENKEHPTLCPDCATTVINYYQG